MCDFETTTIKTNYYKQNKSSRVWLAYGKNFSNIEENKDKDILTTNIDDFFNYFWNQKESATLFFHNLSWDGEFIKWYLVENGFKYFYEEPPRKKEKGFSLFEDESKIYFIHIWKVVRDGKKIKIVNLYVRCSLILLTLSVETLGEKYGITTKSSIGYDVEPFEKIEDVPFELIDYIKRDVEIPIQPLKDFDELFTTKIGNRVVHGLAKLTIGSVSLMLFKSYIHNKYKFKEDFFLPYEDVVELQNWYNGGLCTYNPRYKNKKMSDEDNLNGVVLDVNSMYPSVMVENNYPIGIPSKNYKPSEEYNIKMLKIYINHAKLKKDWYPKLMRPWKTTCFTYDKNAKLVGETRGAIAYYFEDELKSLQRFYNIDYDIIDVWYFKSANYFKDFIMTFYNQRLEYKKQKDSREQMMKIFLNSCYGKFGQKPDKTTIFYDEKDFDYGEKVYSNDKNSLRVDVIRNKENCVGNLKSYICYWETSKSSSINVAIASCVCKNARLKLYDAIYANIDSFIYCDTDSVFLDNKPIGIDIDDNKLGAWKEEMTFNSIELGGAKLYRIFLRGELKKIACAGINKKWAKKNLGKNDIITINKKLGVGSKLQQMKVRGGVVLVEKECVINERG